MKLPLQLITGVVLLGSISVCAQPLQINVVFPSEGAQLPALSQTFIYGSVMPGATLQINGSPVEAYRTGGFLAMVTVHSGTFTFRLEAQRGGEHTQLDRTVYIAEPMVTLPDTPVVIPPSSMEPSSDSVLAAGDILRVSFQGPPGGQATFSIRGVTRHLPMVETGLAGGAMVVPDSGSVRGLYRGTYQIQAGDRAKQATVQFRLRTPRGRVVGNAQGRLTIENRRVPRIGIITEEIVPVRTAPDGGYDFFMFRGMRVWLTGKVGEQWRVRFSESKIGWVRSSSIRELPEGMPVPRSIVRDMRVEYEAGTSRLRIPLSDLLPYQVQEVEAPKGLALTLYGGVNHTNYIWHDVKDPVVKRISWKQAAPDACQVMVELKDRHTLWGYDVRYESSALVMELRGSPVVKAGSLAGLRVVVDAGHGGSDPGDWKGPTGAVEKEISLQSALALADELRRRGATVFLTRQEDINVSLYDRSKYAWDRRADLLLSLHCDGPGLGQNPVERNGFSVYYYHPHSSELARAIHMRYGQRTSIPDRGLVYADFAVCRTPQMPAVLIEQAYIIVPAQEEFLQSKTAQALRAQAIAEGVQEYFDALRSPQQWQIKRSSKKKRAG